MSPLIRRQRGTCRWLQGGLSEARFQDQQGEHRGLVGSLTRSFMASALCWEEGHGKCGDTGVAGAGLGASERCARWWLMPLMAPASKNQQALCEPLQPVCSILTRGRRPGDFSCGGGGGGYGRRPKSRPRCGCPCCRLPAHPLEDGQCCLVPSSSLQKQDRPVEGVEPLPPTGDCNKQNIIIQISERRFWEECVWETGGPISWWGLQETSRTGLGATWQQVARRTDLLRGPLNPVPPECLQLLCAFTPATSKQSCRVLSFILVYW